jgi:3-oxoacyl-[acyl-carrier protein] reductase
MTKIALVTGGSRGIGKATCIELAKNGYWVLINYHNNEVAAKETLVAIQEIGGNGELLQFDVSNFEETQQTITSWQKRNEKAYITTLINNAGIIKDAVFPFMSLSNWNSVISISLNGFYNVTQAVLPAMLKNKEGQIVNVVSVSGLMGIPGQTNYAAAKAGVIGATKSLAVEVARKNVRVNAVAPGFIDTDMTKPLDENNYTNKIPMQRFGLAEEVAKSIYFLVSENSSYITGEVLSINGGLYT